MKVFNLHEANDELGETKDKVQDDEDEVALQLRDGVANRWSSKIQQELPGKSLQYT